VDPLRSFYISFFENTYNRRKFFYDDLESKSINNNLSQTEAADPNAELTSMFSENYNYKEWDRLFDFNDIVETALLLENTLKYCIEYKTTDGKCNRCKEGYQIKNNYCLKNDVISIPNCIKYNGRLSQNIKKN
jgi:hypothetical protein